MRGNDLDVVLVESDEFELLHGVPVLGDRLCYKN
jgi:hypothetical protein